MLFVPQGADFQWYYSNTLTTRPVAAYGTSCTPNTGNDTYGAWAQIASSANVPYDVYGVQICFNNGASSTIDRRILVNFGIDNAGGTNYTTVIPYLIAGKAYPYTTSPSGIWYYFPLYFKAGSSVAIQATSSNTTTFNTSVYLFGLPRRPEALRVGSYVDAFGVNILDRTGTVVTAGTTAEGAWTQLGTATTKSYWWWQIGMGMETPTVNAAVLHADISAGNATNKKILLENQLWASSTLEQLGNAPLTQNAYNNVAIGQLIYGRAQTSGTANATSLIAYGLGG